VKRYKTIRVSDSVLSDLKSLQGKGEQFIDTVARLICSRKIVPGKFLKGDGKYCLEISGKKKELQTEEALNHILRITEENFIQLKEMQDHPDEIFNTIMFRLTSAAMQDPAVIPEIATAAVQEPAVIPDIKKPSRVKTEIAPAAKASAKKKVKPQKIIPKINPGINPAAKSPENTLVDIPETLAGLSAQRLHELAEEAEKFKQRRDRPPMLYERICPVPECGVLFYVKNWKIAFHDPENEYNKFWNRKRRDLAKTHPQEFKKFQFLHEALKHGN
jgi:hypothetical protein